MKRQDYVKVYKTSYGWRWTRYASNGRIVGTCSEFYSRRKTCIENAKRCMTVCQVKVVK